jgi:hypothetical protein
MDSAGNKLLACSSLTGNERGVRWRNLRDARESSIKRGLAGSRSTLFHQRGGTFADFLKRHFEGTKLNRG